MELRQLSYFLAAAQTQNFIQAAELCAVAQSNLSRQIAALENELKVELFSRENRRVFLTNAGREFAEQVKKVFYELDQARQEVSRLQAGESGLVRVGCVQPLAATFLPDVLGKFSQLYPAVKLSVSVGRADELARAVESNRIDLALIFDPASAPSELIIVKELFQQSLQLVVPTGHPFCQADPATLTLRRIAAERLIMLTEPSRLRRTVNRVFAQRGLNFEPQIEVDSTAVLKELVRQGCGLTIMPPVSMQSELTQETGLVFLPISDLAEEFIFALIYRNFGLTSPAVRQLIKMLTNQTF